MAATMRARWVYGGRSGRCGLHCTSRRRAGRPAVDPRRPPRSASDPPRIGRGPGLLPLLGIANPLLPLQHNVYTTLMNVGRITTPSIPGNTPPNHVGIHERCHDAGAVTSPCIRAPPANKLLIIVAQRCSSTQPEIDTSQMHYWPGGAVSLAIGR